MMEVLIKVGANVDTRGSNGENQTPLFIAAFNGHANAVRELLMAKANPLLDWTNPESGRTALPLDVTAVGGHLEVVKKMVRQVGSTVPAVGLMLCLVPRKHNHLDVLVFLMNAGVVDTGEALVQAAVCGSEEMVNFLLQRQQQRRQQGGKSFSDKVLPNLSSRSKAAGGDVALEKIKTLEAIRRLLLRVDAVNAVSWLRPNGAPPAPHPPSEEARNTMPSIPLTLMMPILRRGAARRKVFLTALYRQSSKP
eukprot:g14330.t1